MELYLAALRFSKPGTYPDHGAPMSAAEEDAYYAQFGEARFAPWIGRVAKFITALIAQPGQPAVTSVRHA